MAYDRIVIAPINSGLTTNVRPFLIPDDAFETLENAIVFRGRVRKRWGSRLLGATPQQSRFRVQVGTIGAPVSPVPGAIFQIGQQFSAGTQIFTVYQTGTPAAMLSTGPGTGTFNTTTGAFALAGTGLAGATPIYFYPDQPVMGLTNYGNTTINNQPSYGFDTQFAYVFTGGAWSRSQSGGDPVFKGSDINFFWTTNWRGASDSNEIMYVTNFNATVGAPGTNDDSMWYFDGSTTTWTPFIPRFLPAGGIPPAGPFVASALIILPFKERLFLLNTIEQTGGTNFAFSNRARFSHVGSPLSVNAWYEPNQVDSVPNVGDGGGFVDAPTEERIVGAEFIKDRLIVSFERSTWELAYTGNEVLPVVWQKINTELGTESTFSTVPFDKQILAISNVGVTGCNGANVARIDDQIPDEVFDIKQAGIARVAGVRDYFSEMVYWTYPSDNQQEDESYPNKILVYNYKNQTYGINDDCVTAWGYYEQQLQTTWAMATFTWESSDEDWLSGLQQAQPRQVLAGNQQGFTFLVRADSHRNAPVMSITNIFLVGADLRLTIINHTLETGEYIYIENVQGATLTGIFPVKFIDINTISLGPLPLVGVYIGAGTVARVSNPNILTKQYNPYLDKGKNVSVAKIDFGVERTSNGQITVDYYPSSSTVSMIQAGQAQNSIMGTSVLETTPYTLYPLEQQQQRLWHTLYLQTQGECIQMRIYLSPAQITNILIAFSDFQLDGMILYCQPIGRLQ